MFPEVQSWERKRAAFARGAQMTPRHLLYLFYEAKAFIYGGTNNQHNHCKGTGENSLQLGRRKRGEKNTSPMRGGKIYLSLEESLGEGQET